MSERQERFIELLRRIFEIDKADLDFGIYRILNIRRDKIESFFANELPNIITDILKPFASDIRALESDVYSALYSFFSRYYDEGDFISKRRYKEGVYAIPYEGEEVKLYWANQDQYYIKTTENFKDYTFKSGDYTIHFRLVDATTEQNNNKETEGKKRKFMIFQEDEENYPGVKTFEFNEIKDNEGKANKEYIVRFVYDIPADPKAKWDEINFKTIRDNLTVQPDTQLQVELLRIINPTAEAKKRICLLQKHLNGYVAKNTFDYFIHKDLGGFLTRELDFFIKNEIMHLDDLDTENETRVNTYLAKVRAIKRVGKTIIDFLAQIENFQKKLWLKKKFVVETNWCITLDRIDERFYDEIRNNKAQVQEWKDMYAVNEIVPDLEHTEPFTEIPTSLFLKQNQNLIIDTKHFSDDFKNRLIAGIDNLDEQTGGLMINSDNFHSNMFIEEKYMESINCVYLDPPYNTGPSEILYKNNYKDSSWLSMMKSRFDSMRHLISDDCTIAVAIDDYEMVRIGEMMSEEFVEWKRNMVVVNHHPQGTPKENVSRTHEYSIIMTPSGEAVMSNDGDVNGYETRALMRSGSADNNYRYGRPNSFYAILVNPLTKQIMGAEKPPLMGSNYPTHDTVDGYKRIYPISNGVERVWRISYNSSKVDYINDSIEKINSLICCSKLSYTLYQKVTEKRKPINSNWTDKRYNAGTYGTTLLSDIFGENVPFKYPKSLYTVRDYIDASTNINEPFFVLDFFGGSGTTGHAVIDLNRQDGGQRKYILVDMALYFNTATLPRVKKIVYSSEWKDGKPKSHSEHYSHIMKYLRLESYEDALSNIELKENTGMYNQFGDEYLINYMLDIESKESLLNLKAFKTPFEYEMKITEKNECKQQRVDVCETFNYLIGLNVVRQGEIKYFNVKAAQNPEYEGAVDLVGDNNGQYEFRQIEGTLRDGRRTLVIWRNITDDIMQSNAALDAYFTKYRINPLDREFDVIYVNGDSNLENLRTDDESWKVVRTETEFNKRMFEEE